VPIQLANGSWRVQIRRAGFARVDRVFKSQKAAAAFETAERAILEAGPTPLTPKLRLADAVDLYQRSSV
jgi:hypothetical protein